MIVQIICIAFFGEGKEKGNEREGKEKGKGTGITGKGHLSSCLSFFPRLLLEAERGR